MPRPIYGYTKLVDPTKELYFGRWRSVNQWSAFHTNRRTQVLIPSSYIRADIIPVLRRRQEDPWDSLVVIPAESLSFRLGGDVISKYKAKKIE